MLLLHPSSADRLGRGSHSVGVGLSGGCGPGRPWKILRRRFGSEADETSGCSEALLEIASERRFRCRVSRGDRGGGALAVLCMSVCLRRGLRLRSLGDGGAVAGGLGFDEADELGLVPLGGGGPPRMSS